MKLAADGAYDGTTFHRVVKYGMVQGGDPLTKDPAKRALYGTGGQNAVKAEARAPKMTRGSVAAVLVPGKPDSAGAQFFIVLADQPALDNQYTVFAHVADGIEVLQKISETPVDDKGVATERVEIRHVTIRDTPAGAVRHRDRGGARRLSRRARHERRADHDRVLRRQGAEHRPSVHAARRGRRLQRHGVPPRRAGLRHPDRRAVEPRRAAHARSSRRWCTTSPPEFNDTKHVKGIVSMARGDAPDSATTSFFICTGTVDGARRRLHRVRSRRRRHGGGRGDRGGAAHGRDAEHADRSQDGQDREEGLGWTSGLGTKRCRDHEGSKARRRTKKIALYKTFFFVCSSCLRVFVVTVDLLAVCVSTDWDRGLRGRDQPGDADRDADQVLDLDAVARLEVVADHRLRADARHVDLAVRDPRRR